MAKYLDSTGLSTFWTGIKSWLSSNLATVNGESLLSGRDITVSVEGVEADLSELEAKIDSNTELIVSLHATASLTASPTVIEKGVSTSVTFTGTGLFNGSTDSLYNLVLTDSGNNIITSSTSSTVTYTASLSDSTTYYLDAYFDSDMTISVQASRTVNAYYPIYLLTSSSSSITSGTTITSSGTKQSIKSSAAGSYSVTTSSGDYVWLFVPSGVTVPTSATISGFDCPLADSTTISSVSVNSATVSYTALRTEAAMSADTFTIVYA